MSSTDQFTLLVAHAIGDFFANSTNKSLLLSSVLTVALLALLWWVLFAFLPGLVMDRHLMHVPQVRGRLPFFGHALLLLEGSPTSKMAAWSLDPLRREGGKRENGEKINRLVTFNVFSQRVVYINEPALLKRVLLTNQRNYIKDIPSSYKHFMCLLGSGLVTAEGDKWRKGRLMLSHSLRIDILEDIPEMAVKATGRILDKMPTTTGGPSFIDLNEEFRHMTLQVIGETVLSLTPEETDRIFPTLYLPIVHECNRLVWEPWRSLLPFSEGARQRRSCLKKLNRVICNIIRERWKARSETGKRDVMSLCMSQIDSLTSGMVAQLRDDVKTLLLAGHETSAALLTWATYEVICHPEVRDKIVEEARVLFDPVRCERTVVTPYGTWGIPTASDVRALLRWTPATLRETLRKHSVVPLVMRLAKKNDTWPASETGLERDITIPAGCSVAVGIEAVHHRPDIWPDSDMFRPERFLDVDTANSHASGRSVDGGRSIDPYAFLPFINGPRNCLGQHLSMMETQVSLAFLFLNCDLRLCDVDATGGHRDALELQHEVGQPHAFLIPIVPRNGLKVHAVPAAPRPCVQTTATV
ncbi:putative Cytochrome P450 [Trypanosoma vivax]|uniref:Putative cytochrome P450 n=1 Tax=Trypanosoma vivax (strain Y486) TaxID=1055687 RepID=G0TS86_TRYVY|nr:putative Cytochrome P450 [Trypanosoma vivax]CCC46812.1 putative cytochrome P450 [Trypanosoma vivax Y486]